LKEKIMKSIALASVIALFSVPAAATDDEPLARRPAIEEASIVTRNFYTGTLNWYFQPGASGGLTVTGYTSSPVGGTVTQVTICFYNESAFVRTFTASASVQQGSSTIQSITFSRDFNSERFSCHTLTGFNAVVAPGNFSIAASFNAFQADNVFAGFGATDSGDIFDVAIGSARPPFASGPQGPIQMHGVGLGYRITENDAPPPGCVADNDTLCLNNGRFKVEATFNTGSQNGNAQVVKLTDETGYLWFFNASNVEAVIKVLNGCPVNQNFWVFTAGLTNVRVDITVTDTQTDTSKTYTNPLNTKYVAVQDTAAFATCNP
jgi:hypothetical protein